MKAVWTYDFECDKPMAEIVAILNETGPWTWTEQTGGAGLGPHVYLVSFGGLQIRICGLGRDGRNGPAYTADLKMDESCKADRASIERVFRESLRKLAARNVTKGEYYD